MSDFHDVLLDLQEILTISYTKQEKFFDVLTHGATTERKLCEAAVEALAYVEKLLESP